MCLWEMEVQSSQIDLKAIREVKIQEFKTKYWGSNINKYYHYIFVHNKKDIFHHIKLTDELI